MSGDRPPARVRVTGPPRHGHRRGRGPSGPGALDGESPLGRVYLASLLREQRTLALQVLAALALTVGALPLVFRLWPGLADVGVLGLPLGWVLLGVLVYPLLVVLAWAYVRRAERNERDFVALLGDRPDEAS